MDSGCGFRLWIQVLDSGSGFSLGKFNLVRRLFWEILEKRQRERSQKIWRRGQERQQTQKERGSHDKRQTERDIGESEELTNIVRQTDIYTHAQIR